MTSEQQFTAPETGWYRLVPGGPVERLNDAEAQQLASSGAQDVIRYETTEHETRAYQNSGANLRTGTQQIIPNGAWVTLPQASKEQP